MTARTFTARYSGKCPACGEVIESGDVLRWSDDDQAIHATCEPAYDDKGAARETCSKCWQVVAVNGECGCDA